MYRSDTSLGVWVSGSMCPPWLPITSGSLGVCEKHLQLYEAWCWLPSTFACAAQALPVNWVTLWPPNRSAQIWSPLPHTTDIY